MVVNWVKTLPQKSDFPGKRVHENVVPGLIEVVCVEVNEYTHAVEFYCVDKVIRGDSDLLKARIRPEFLQKWRGKLASEAEGFTDYFTRLYEHNFERSSWAQDMMKKLDKFIPRELPKDFDLSPYIERVRLELNEPIGPFEQTLIETGLFGKDGEFMKRQEAAYSHDFSPVFKKLTKLKKDLVEGNTAELRKTNDLLTNSLTGMGAFLGSGSAYLIKSPFFIRNSAKAVQEELFAHSLEDSFFSAEGIAETTIPKASGLSGVAEIGGQPFVGALMSFMSMTASSKMSTEYRTHGVSSAPLSGKITQEEADRLLEERLAEEGGTRRLAEDGEGEVSTTVSTAVMKKKTDSTDVQERATNLEAASRAQFHLGTTSYLNTNQQIQMFAYLHKDLHLRSVEEQLAVFLDLVMGDKDISHLFNEKYLHEFENLPKPGDTLKYRWEEYIIDSIDIIESSDGEDKRTYIIHAISQKSGIQPIGNIPSSQLTLISKNHWVR